VELIKLVFTQLAPQLDIPITPHALDLRKHMVDEFAKATNEGTNVSPFRLAKTAAGLFVPNTARERRIKSHVANGWDADRLAFAMVIAVNNRNHSKTYHYIVGTTDEDMHAGTDSKIVFDKKMKLYFDKVTRVHMNESRHRDRNVWVPKIQAHDQILNRASLTGYDRDNIGLRDRPVSLRPTDIFRRRTGATQFAKHFSGDENVTNMCGAFTSQLKASTLDNNSTSMYLSRTLSAYMASAADPEQAHHYDEGQHDTLNHAHDRVEENDLELDPWIEQMKEQYRILDDGYITFGQLQRMNPDYDWDKIIFGRTGRGGRGISLANQAGWNGTDNETVAARIIAQSLPNLMIQSMYNEVEHLVLDSTVRSGQNEVEISKVWPFVDGISTQGSWPYFESACSNILLREATCGGRFQVTARIDANLDRLIKIWIRIDHGEEAYFEFPACMSGAVAPTLETDNKAFDSLAKGIVGLAAELSARRLDAMPTHTDSPKISLSSDMRSARDDRTRDRDDRSDDRRSDRRTRSQRDW
jgi:hypothetical protein